MTTVPPAEHLIVETLTVGASSVIAVSGELDVLTAPKLAKAVNGAIDALATKIVLDCADLTYIDSSGIGVLIVAWEQLRDRATMPVVVTNLQPQVRRILDACGITSLVVE